MTDADPDFPKLIDVPTVCRMTSLSLSRVYALIAEGELRRVKIGRKTLFVETEIAAWVNAKIAASVSQQAAA